MSSSKSLWYLETVVALLLAPQDAGSGAAASPGDALLACQSLAGCDPPRLSHL